MIYCKLTLTIGTFIPWQCEKKKKKKKEEKRKERIKKKKGKKRNIFSNAVLAFLAMPSLMC